MHPDLASDEDNREIRNRWMVEINAAYQSGDEEGLAALLEKWFACPESVQGIGTQADLERTVRKIAAGTERMKAIQEELDRLKHSFAYSLRARMRAAEKEGRDLLDEMSKKIEKQIARKQRLLDDLVKNAPPVWNIEW
jgi:type II secretory pathway component PulF